MTAWSRLAPFDKGKTGFIQKTDLARQFQVTLQRGFANFFPQAPVPFFGNPNGTAPQQTPLPMDTPSWFRKMDANGDGDVSPAEFLGSRAEFDRIDTDRDGLISAEEAIRYDALQR